MAEDKKGFLMYADQREQFDQLTDEQAGKLIKYLFAYVNDEDPKTDDIVTKLSFTPIKNQLKRDLEKWSKTREVRSKAGLASAEARKIKKEQEATNSTSVKSVQQNSTNSTDSVNENVNVNDNDIVNVKGKKEDNKGKIVYSKEVHRCYSFCINQFEDYLIPKNKSDVNNWLDTIEKLNRIDKIPFEFINQITEGIRKDGFWSKHFLSLTKLRKKNGDGVMYIVVFNEQLKSNQNGTKQPTNEELFNAVRDLGLDNRE